MKFKGIKTGYSELKELKREWKLETKNETVSFHHHPIRKAVFTKLLTYAKAKYGLVHNLSNVGFLGGTQTKPMC